MWKELFLIGVLVILVSSAPQGNQEQYNHEPYDYAYKVEDPAQSLFFDKNEVGDSTGAVTGRYSVWLPDGRLMTVEYTVTKDTGFVPRVSFQENANPLG